MCKAGITAKLVCKGMLIGNLQLQVNSLILKLGRLRQHNNALRTKEHKEWVKQNE
jgi:hypothetical protein